MTRSLPIHLAVYWHGVAESRDGQIRMRSAFGPYVECLADHVNRITVVAHDPPLDPAAAEDLADYVVHSSRANISVLSLGPKGDRRDYFRRRSRISSIVGPASEEWDVLLMRFGRRANLVFRANECPRLVTIVWGPASTLRLRRAQQGIGALGSAAWSAWHLKQVLADSGLAITDGEACLKRYQRLVPGGHMELIRSSSRRARYEQRVDDRLTRADPRFIFVGHATAAKGLLDAIEAFARIRQSTFPAARLDVVGAGPGLDEARQAAAREGVADADTFHGWIPAGDELYRLYERADVLLFLSRSETESLPRVVSEAMAMSVLVVSTPVGSLPLAFQDERELLFVPIGDTGAAESAAKLLASRPDLRRRLLREGYKRAGQFTLEHVADALLAALVRRWPELRTLRGAPLGANPEENAD
jgi:glycosyltransferase involved in cell wall biosynthesis